MRLLLTHPFFWPHVRRGAEREVHDVGAGLAARGNRVRLLTGQPGGLTSRGKVDGIRVRYVRTPLPGALRRRGWQREGAFGGVAALGAAVSAADAVVAYHYADGYGATLAARLPGRRGRPVVLKLTGAVPRDRVDGERVERALIARALDGADEVWVNSAYVADVMSGWGRPMRVLPAGVDRARFAPVAERAPEPVVLCTAAAEEPRKRLVDLLDAWPAVLDALPGARLVLAHRDDPALRRALLDRLPPATRPSVEFAGVLHGERLVAAYSSAWATVAPAVHEALGLATLESLACGTPVAGAASGATPELLAAAGTGALFAPADPAACAAAVVEAVRLGADPASRVSCRAATDRYDLDAVVGEVERRLVGLVAGAAAATPAARERR